MRKSFLTALACSLVFFTSNSFIISRTANSIPYSSEGREKVTVTTDPQTARIYINGVLTGTGKVEVTVPKGDCVKVEVKLEGFVQETRNYCDRKGMSSPPGTDYIQLQADDSYTSSVQSDVANNEILLGVKKGKSREEAWKTIVQTVLSKFDVLENNDEKSGYLRTAWVGQTFMRGNNTIRTRVVIKLSSEDPLAFKIKFVSEESRRAGTAFNADEQYAPFARILKKYDGFIDEMLTKLGN